MFKRSAGGQSTLEYVIMLAAVVGAIIIVGRVLKPKVSGSYDTIGNRIKNMVEK